MTKVRHIVKGQTVMVTRRIHQRQFALRPDQMLNRIAGYLLAVATARFGVELHSTIVMSDHVHLILTDVRGNLPDFMQWYFSLMARAVNTKLFRRDTLWSGSKPEVTILGGPQDILAKCAYVLANPVQDGAVAYGKQWPGIRNSPTACLRPGQLFGRPRTFFSQDGTLPTEAALTFTAPPAYDGTPEQWAQDLTRAVEQREDDARAKMHAAGRRFMGARRCIRVDWRLKSTRPERVGPGTAPLEVVAADQTLRRDLLASLANFRRAYAEARTEWVNAAADVDWPPGTWAPLRALRRAAPPPPDT